MRKRTKVLWAIIASIPIAIAVAAVAMPWQFKRALEVYREDGFSGVYSGVTRRAQGHFARCPLMLICTDDEPTLPWETTTPESVGLNGERLEALSASLKEQGTTSFLVVRDNQIAFEWYAYGYGPNDLHSLAAAAKAITASVIVLALLTDGRLELDQRLAEFVPAWEQDSEKSRITIRQLASHSSGMDDVDLGQAQTGWKEIYRLEDDRRFRLALDQAPTLFEPGTAFLYSGLGYYPLAYGLGAILARSEPPTDLKSYLNARVMEHLGIPVSEWRLSYGRAYEVDGMTLYAIGSGASYTARSAARIAQLFAQDGAWNGRQILDPAGVRRALSYAESPPTPAAGASEPPAGLGWWVNSYGFFASLPEDAAVAMGDGQIVVVVPSWNLVAVRFGGSLGRPDDGLWESAEQEFFEPLAAALISD